MKTNKSKRGFALLSVLFIITALALSLGMLIQIGTQRAFDARRLTNKAKALAYAEAGVDHAYAILSVDFDQRNNPSAFSLSGSGTGSGTVSESSDGSTVLSSAGISSSPVKSDYSDGTFELTVTPISNRYAVVNCVGECGGITAEAEVLVEDIYAGSGGSEAIDYESMEGFNYTILSGGTFDFKGSGSVGSGGKMHSNSEIDINGSANTEVDISSTVEIGVGNNTVKGSISAPELDLHQKASITGGSTEQVVPPVSIPDIDFTPYYNWAKKHGEVHHGYSTTISDTPNGGILYVIGDVTISSHAVINGSIIATGDIKISGHAKVTPTIDAIAIATGSGDIDNTSSERITGLIYSKTGNYKQTANGELYGQLIVGGEIQKGGNSDIVFYQKSIPTPPGVASVTPTKSLPVVSAWQK
jgi:cytoskeletal protein CcmA (bactofilin family)